jgi:hypothetical protein
MAESHKATKLHRYSIICDVAEMSDVQAMTYVAEVSHVSAMMGLPANTF